jgi:hypothetical protein
LVLLCAAYQFCIFSLIRFPCFFRPFFPWFISFSFL